MLKKFIVKNYKNFKNELELNLGNVGGYKFNAECINNNQITKCLIYGRNATGKSNLGKAIMDITDILFPISHRYITEKILNADSADETAMFLYDFIFNDDEVEYTYYRNGRGELTSEKLIVNRDIIFEIDFESPDSSNINLLLVDADTIKVEKYINMLKHSTEEIEDDEYRQVPFLRYVLSSAALMPGTVLRRLEDYIKRMRISVASATVYEGRRIYTARLNEYLTVGDNLKKFEQFLNLMGVECRLEIVKSVDGQYELFFKHKTLVPFYANASSGTLTLVNFYRRILAMDKNPSLFYMDEFDAFYNYEMSEKIVKYLKNNFPNSQIIMTTHNTNLMTNQLMRPDCLFILSREGKITPLCEATERELREGHNLEKLYIAGEFEKYE